MSLLSGGGMVGDIWSTGAFSFESPLKDLLDSGDYTLEQLLAEDELLQELRGVHPELIQFFSTPQAVTKLVQYVILPLDEIDRSGAAAAAPENPQTEKPKEAKELESAEQEANGDKIAPQATSDEAAAAVDASTTTTTAAAATTARVTPRDPGEWLRNYNTENPTAKSKTPQDDPEMRHIRFPYMACEIVCCEIQSVVDMLVDGHVPSEEPSTCEKESGGASASDDEKGEKAASATEDKKEGEDASREADPAETATATATEPPPTTRILDLLFSLLYTTPPGQLDDYRAGYFEKILTVLFRKRPAELSDYINSGGGKGAETLMATMFDHLYSHSIMQIAQRLLLPQRPTPPKTPEEEQQEQDEAGGAEIVAPEEQDPQEEDVGVQCDWSRSSRALEMLLEGLINPVVKNHASAGAGDAEKEQIDEQRLDLSLNASEVLITIIQNSMLSSETMLSLTSPETLQRIVVAATTLRGHAEGEEPFFSPHESLLTSAMNVLESLILQLGGYGAVGTMFLLPEENQELQQEQPQQTEEEEAPNEEPEQSKQLIADLSAMVDVLPQLLEALSNLMRHPSTKKWTSPMQFTKTAPQLLLGGSRLRIVRVLESLVLLGDPEVDAKLIQSDCLEICLDLFWEFQWCSMLHQSVANLLVHIFEGQNARIEMQEYFLIKCNLLGRLMDSFLEVQDTSRIADVVMNLKDVSLNQAGVSSSVASEKGSSTGPLPVSEDDVDAAMEKQEEAEMSSDPKGVDAEQVSTEAVRFESRDASTIGMAAPAQAFRFGYMGHVIIICQALVHACSNEMDQDEEQMQLENGDPANPASPGEPALNEDPHWLAELVANHALAERWNEFVVTTLATETAIQSSPLGGYGTGTPGPPDPHQSHRPGLADDGDIMGDDGMGPPAPPRGMLGGGDVIDMDDNDLEIAASMMANLNLTRPAPDEDDNDNSSNSGSLASGDSEKSYNSGETAHDRTGYAFDDPLGKAGGLGIELGKLTQYKRSDSDEVVEKGGGSGGDDDDDGSHSSSDEEPDSRGSAGSGDVPVMDLFAGNFDPNFANFDNPGDDEFGDFASATIESNDAPTSQQPEARPDIEDIFGKGDHADLLEVDDDEPVPGSDEGGAATGETESSSSDQINKASAAEPVDGAVTATEPESEQVAEGPESEQVPEGPESERVSEEEPKADAGGQSEAPAPEAPALEAPALEAPAPAAPAPEAPAPEAPAPEAPPVAESPQVTESRVEEPKAGPSGEEAEAEMTAE